MQPPILINCKWQTSACTTGVQRYASELINELTKTQFPFDCAKPQSGSIWNSNYWEQFTLPKLARKYDTLYCPANSAPIMLPKKVRLILTIHCLRFRSHPESYSRPFTAWYRFMIPRIITRAETILTVSNTTAEEIQNTYPHARGKVKVIYPGVSQTFNTKGPTGDQSIPPGPYMVYIGNTTPAKNLAVLLQAMKISHHPHRLILLGINKQQLTLMTKSTPNETITPLGHINDPARIAAILRGATALLAPSLYESYDLPTVEAMACGCPVIASDTKVHREIGKNAPIFVPPHDAQQWATVIDQLADNTEMTQERSQAGITRASDFRWDQTAAKVMEIISNQS